MNVATRFFLVLLQLAIGWHFAYEGWWKISQSKTPWSAKGYIEHATGPLALPIRAAAGDPEVVHQNGRYSVVDHGRDFLVLFPDAPQTKPPPEKADLNKYMPTPLAKTWDDYFQAFCKKYKFDEPASQKRLCAAECAFLEAKNDAVDWLFHGVKKATPPHFSGSMADVPSTTPERVAHYRKLLSEDIAEHQRAEDSLGAGAAAKLRKAQDEANAIRKGLLADLDEQTNAMKGKLRDLLTYEEKRAEAPADPAKAEKLIAPPAEEWSRIKLINNTVKYGLLAVGLALLFGCFTRLASLAGVAFLIAFYLAMPPWPGVAEATAGKSHFLYINENIIESLALLVIAVSHPGRRYGIDAWVRTIWNSMGFGGAGKRPSYRA